MTTPAQTMKNRAATLAREAAELSAATREADGQVKSALMRYAAGLADLPEVQQAQTTYRAALDAEQAHGAALELLDTELAAHEQAERKAALTAELDTAREKLSLIEASAARRLELAEREYRAAFYAAQKARRTAQEIRTQAQTAGFQRLALVGEGVDTSQRVPTPQEREGMLTALEGWNIRDEQAMTLPPALVMLPANPADSDDDHARRWNGVLAALKDK